MVLPMFILEKRLTFHWTQCQYKGFCLFFCIHRVKSWIVHPCSGVWPTVLDFILCPTNLSLFQGEDLKVPQTCTKQTCVCHTCRAEFMKQVLPRLVRPQTPGCPLYESSSSKEFLLTKQQQFMIIFIINIVVIIIVRLNMSKGRTN